MTAWDQQPDEPHHWFSRFDIYYRTLPPSSRSVEEAWRQWKKAEPHQTKANRPSSHWKIRSAQWKWKERAQAYDNEQRRQRMIDEQEAIADANKRHRKLAEAMQVIGAEVLRILQKDPADIKPSDARQFIESGVKIERETLGMPTEFVKIMGMSNDELTAYYNSLRTRFGRSDSDAGDVADRSGDEATGNDISSDSGSGELSEFSCEMGRKDAENPLVE